MVPAAAPPAAPARYPTCRCPSPLNQLHQAVPVAYAALRGAPPVGDPLAGPPGVVSDRSNIRLAHRALQRDQVEQAGAPCEGRLGGRQQRSTISLVNNSHFEATSSPTAERSRSAPPPSPPPQQKPQPAAKMSKGAAPGNAGTVVARGGRQAIGAPAGAAAGLRRRPSAWPRAAGSSLQRGPDRGT
jgi:hypothetical protein